MNKLLALVASLLLTACQTAPSLSTEVDSHEVDVPVAVACVTPDALPKPRFLKEGTVDQDFAAASLELREWRKFGKAVLQQCALPK